MDEHIPNPMHSVSEPEPHARCGARCRDGHACTLPPIRGGVRCRMHGGAAPRAKAAARRNLEQQKALKAMTTYGLAREVAPDVALLEEVHRTAGHVAWLGQVVAEIEREDLVWGQVQIVDKGSGQWGGTDTTHSAQVNIWLDLYQKERKHLADVCKAALAAGIAERQVKLAEQQGALIAQVISRILDDLNLSAEQRALVPEVVPRQLMALVSAA